MENYTETRFDECVDDVLNEYFEWLYFSVCSDEYSKGKSWRKLFRLLHETEFVYIHEKDRNRAIDGMTLRYHFGYSKSHDGNYIRQIEDALGIGIVPSSVLEMMIALAKRCETDITSDAAIGDRTAKWFFAMIESLGLLDMDDSRFDKIVGNDILSRFMRLEYRPDGRGGLFTTSDPNYDMRDHEIWFQMMKYLNENVYRRDDL